MHVGVTLPYKFGNLVDPEFLTEFARSAEENGFESLWLGEHMVLTPSWSTQYTNPTGPPAAFDEIEFPDPLELLGFVAAVTRRIKLGTAVLLLPQRNPVVTAKQVATLDRLSRGRVLLGVGVGWLRDEAEAVGTGWHDRGARMDEYIEAMRVLWRERDATYHGRYVNFTAVRCLPQPHRPEGVPILIGGQSAAARRRAGRLGDGYVDSSGGADDAALEAAVSTVRAAAREAGRDPLAIEITSTTLRGFDVDRLRRLQDLGVARVRFGVRGSDLPAMKRSLEEVAERVIARVAT